jgi:hypothetical protein
MAKVILGARPKTFTPIRVKFPMPDGDEGVITVTFKYRTRVEFGEMLDAIVNAAPAETFAAPVEPVAAKPVRGKKAAAPAAVAVDPVAPFRVAMAGMYGTACDRNAEHLMLSVEAWDLDQPLSEKTLRQLADELPGACVAIMTAYNGACTEGRLGN